MKVIKKSKFTSSDFKALSWYKIVINEESDIRTDMEGEHELMYISYELTPDYMLSSAAEYTFKTRDGEIVTLLGEQIKWNKCRKIKGD